MSGSSHIQDDIPYAPLPSRSEIPHPPPISIPVAKKGTTRNISPWTRHYRESLTTIETQYKPHVDARAELTKAELFTTFIQHDDTYSKYQPLHEKIHNTPDNKSYQPFVSFAACLTSSIIAVVYAFKDSWSTETMITALGTAPSLLVATYLLVKGSCYDPCCWSHKLEILQKERDAERELMTKIIDRFVNICVENHRNHAIQEEKKEARRHSQSMPPQLNLVDQTSGHSTARTSPVLLSRSGTQTPSTSRSLVPSPVFQGLNSNGYPNFGVDSLPPAAAASASVSAEPLKPFPFQSQHTRGTGSTGSASGHLSRSSTGTEFPQQQQSNTPSRPGSDLGMIRPSTNHSTTTNSRNRHSTSPPSSTRPHIVLRDYLDLTHEPDIDD